MGKLKYAHPRKKKPDGFPYVMTFATGEEETKETLTLTIFAYTMREALAAGVKAYEAITGRPFDKAEVSHEIFACH